MIFDLLMTGDIKGAIISFLLSVPIIILILSVHEYAHGLVAKKLGDPTAESLGRLTLNPIKHLDPIGALCMLFFHIGWAKPVPINARNFKDPKKGFAITALAGPVSNILLGFVFALFYLLAFALLKDVRFVPNSFSYNLASNLLLFLLIFHTINIGLGIFNLLPIPPFDGSRLLNVFLPPKYYFGIMKYERYIYYGTLAWLLLGDNVAYFLRQLPIIATVPFLYTTVGIFSLSGMLSAAIDFISGLCISFWQLIPFLRF